MRIPRSLLAVVAGLALAVGAAAAPQAAADPAVAAAPDVDVEAVKGHLEQFQSIADSSGGNRAAGSQGYAASADYVASTLTDAGFDVTRQPCDDCGGDDNVIADWPGGDEASTIMLGGHLDSVSAGPDINDNASGSAALLEIALLLAETKPELTNHVRFAWWAAEEQGLIGSQYYVQNSGVDDLKMYLNLDMVGSPNPGYFVGEIGSEQAQPFVDYLEGVGKSPEETGACCSDDGSFSQAGVPTTFIFTGASDRMTDAQASKWGGEAGKAYDPCYHAGCDSYPDNIHSEALNHMADATAHALWELAA
ncbi:MAG: M28 family peptidase [Stackebrandtia sp.]